MTGQKNAKLMDRRSAAISNGVGLMHPLFAREALNAELWDVGGNRFIDFASGIAVTNCGHRAPAHCGGRCGPIGGVYPYLSARRPLREHD